VAACGWSRLQLTLLMALVDVTLQILDDHVVENGGQDGIEGNEECR
jgi:hypothetical protein